MDASDLWLDAGRHLAALPPHNHTIHPEVPKGSLYNSRRAPGSPAKLMFLGCTPRLPWHISRQTEIAFVVAITAYSPVLVPHGTIAIRMLSRSPHSDTMITPAADAIFPKQLAKTALPPVSPVASRSRRQGMKHTLLTAAPACTLEIPQPKSEEEVWNAIRRVASAHRALLFWPEEPSHVDWYLFVCAMQWQGLQGCL
jgi:hypothetical protein